MWFVIGQYLKFLLKSKNQHGVHSPFVYELVTKCFYDTSYYEPYQAIKTYRNRLHNFGNETIRVTDFGAGSKVFKSKEREVSHIAKHAGSSLKRVQLLFRIVRYFKMESILELGTSLGIATSAMALANPNSKVISIEGCKETAHIAKLQFDEFNLDNITLKVNTFEEGIQNLDKEIFNLIFIDGHHNKRATLNYFNSLLDYIDNDSIIIIDDIHWSKDMLEAWEIIKKNKQATVTIDTFYWGMVFFRKEQAKEDFKIRV